MPSHTKLLLITVMISRMFDCASWSRSIITGSSTFSDDDQPTSFVDGLMMRKSFRMILLSLLPSKQNVCSPPNPRSVATAICSCWTDNSVHSTSSSVYLIFSTGSNSVSVADFTSFSTREATCFIISEEILPTFFVLSSSSRFRITEFVGFANSV